MESETPLLNLFCNEDMSSLTATFTEKDESFDFYPVSDSDCEFIEMSFLKETNFRPDPEENQIKKWAKSTRMQVLKWILQARVLFGYHYRTAYLSLIYFDQFMAKLWLSDVKPLWTSRILSIACLSIAAKVEENKARSFAEYHVDGYNFQGIAIQRMELCVLGTLGWKMVLLTPFTYLSYFATKFWADEKSKHQEIVTESADLVLGIMEEINVAETRPSIVAAASVLAAYDRHMDKTMLETQIDAIPTWGSEEKKQTYSCYRLLQEILMLKTPKSAVIPSSLSVAESTVTSRGGSYKRRLAFDNPDQYCPVRKSLYHN